MSRPPSELLEFIDRYDPQIRLLTLGLRGVVHEEMAPCHEYIFTMRSKVIKHLPPTTYHIPPSITPVPTIVYVTSKSS